jgi:uncharacterized protein (DUF1697 family)
MRNASQRYIAFLRGVSPMNAKMPALQRAFEAAGFADVKTVLGTGNVVFSAEPATLPALAKRCEAAMQKQLGSSFFTLVRSVDELTELLNDDPLAGFRLSRGSKRVITFLAEPPRPPPQLPIELSGARILSLRDDAVFSAYVPSPKGPVFMSLLERTFGKNITTRTWETVARCIKVAAPER